MHKLIVTLDSIRNSCDVLYVSIIILYHNSGWSSEGFSMRTAGHGDCLSIDYFLNLNITNIINITNPCLVCQLRGALVVIWNITFNLDVAAR